MKVQETALHGRLRPQKRSGWETPHATIETNTTCNIKCAYCYSVDHPLVKPLDLARYEVDFAIASRSLDAISLLGGEPTLHPDIVDIVRYVKSNGVHCIPPSSARPA